MAMRGWEPIEMSSTNPVISLTEGEVILAQIVRDYIGEFDAYDCTQEPTMHIGHFLLLWEAKEAVRRFVTL